MQMSKTQEETETQALLDDDKILSSGDNTYRRNPCRLQWAESSWTRLLYVLFWWWIYPVLSLGYKRQLTENDLDDLCNADTSSALLERLNSHDWSSTTTSKIIIKEFWKDYLFANLFLIPTLAVGISQPLLVREIILNMMNQHGSNVFSYVCAILLFVCVILQSVFHRQSMFRSARVGVRIRNALTIKIYVRSLSMKSSRRNKFSTGEIINLVANDASKFEEMYSYLQYLCAGIVEAVIIFGLVCWIIHPIPALSGYAVFPLFILIQWYFSRKFGQYRETTNLCIDKRVQAFTEFVRGCHIVKMYNWEKPMEHRIGEFRKNELQNIRRLSHFRALNMSQFFISISILAFITFGSAWLLGYPLNPANTFPVLGLFSLIRINVMYFLPMAVEKLSEARAASRRIDSFMRVTIEQQYQSELFSSSINQQGIGSIFISDGFFSWNDEEPCLSSINLTITQGIFVGIVGPVGSGKSSLLAAILGEMNLINGQLNTNDSSISYVAQIPWIFADTFRNNILLNRPFDEILYRNVIHACCLDVDLSLFRSGDLTIIGENGINLSGGQKARVALARALYTNADIYLLDDPISAVDHKVAKQIYERCIGPYGLLKNKTRLLVTHHIEFLSEAHQIIYLEHGYVDRTSYLEENNTKNSDVTNKKETSVVAEMLYDNMSTIDTQPIIAEEIPHTNAVKWSVWYQLLFAPPLGRFGFILLIILLLLGEALSDGSNYCLSLWLKQCEIDQQCSSKFAYIYFGLILSTIFADFIRTNYYFLIILNGSNNLHKNMLRGLLYSSVQFFEANPTGRIINRASKDQHVIDELLPAMLLIALITLLVGIGSMIMMCILNPFILILLILLLPAIILIINFYQRSFPQLKRMESITRSPVYSLLSSTLDGLVTIRAFQAEKSFIQLISDKIDLNTSACITVQAASAWFSVILNILFSLLLLVNALLIIILANETHVSLTALNLMTSMQLSFWFQWAFRELSEASIMMTSAERIDEYSHLPSEEDKGGPNRLVQTSPTWPIHGAIEFRNYSLRHRFNLDYAIKNINLRIESGQKIGIIGRTGIYEL